jgi:glycosyltransferase involved in cell wall biosynthesis
MQKMVENKQKKYRVLFLSSWYPTKIKPTLGNFVERHAAAVALYADVSVLHICFDAEQKEELIIDRFSKNRINTIIYYLKKSKMPIFSPIINFNKYRKIHEAALKKEYLDFPFDIIHANVLFPLMAALKKITATRKIPYIITEHSTKYHGKISFLHRFFLKKYADKNAVYTPVTNNLAEAMHKNGIKGEYHRINNVVDTAVFSLKKERNDGKIRFLHISTLVDEHKNISGILNVVAQLAENHLNFELHIISDGNQEPFIQSTKEKNLLNSFVFFHGEKSIAEIAAFMPNCDVLLLFSNYENFPCVIVEALASGLAVISTDVGGIKEHLTKNYGILIQKGDEQALYSEMEKMIRGELHFDAEKARNYAIENFSYEAVGKEFVDLYQKLIQENSV